MQKFLVLVSLQDWHDPGPVTIIATEQRQQSSVGVALSSDLFSFLIRLLHTITQ